MIFYQRQISVTFTNIFKIFNFSSKRAHLDLFLNTKKRNRLQSIQLEYNLKYEKEACFEKKIFFYPKYCRPDCRLE